VVVADAPVGVIGVEVAEALAALVAEAPVAVEPQVDGNLFMNFYKI
jgi:hypothetical protein